MESMAADFKPEEFTDDYRAALQQVIDAKVSGKEIVAPPEAEEAPSGAIDLMAALRASVERAKAARESGGAEPEEHEPIAPTPITAAKSAKKAGPVQRPSTKAASPSRAADGAKAAPAKKAAPKKAAQKRAPAAKATEGKAKSDAPAKKAASKRAPAKSRRTA